MRKNRNTYRRLLEKPVRQRKNLEYQDIDVNRWYNKLKLNTVALDRERTIPTERPPPVGEVSANFCG